MKQLRKADMLKKGQEGHIRAERDLLASASTTTRWTVGLASSFQDVDHLYLVMSYMAGGGASNFFCFSFPVPTSDTDLLTTDLSSFPLSLRSLSSLSSRLLSHLCRPPLPPHRERHLPRIDGAFLPRRDGSRRRGDAQGPRSDSP
jgi:hypothetical protein